MLFVDRALATRLEVAQAWRGVHYAHAQRALRPASNSTARAVAGGQMLYAGPNSPLNRAIALGMLEGVTPADLDTVEQFYQQRHTAAHVDVCPLADPTLVDLLRQRAYRVAYFQSVLACALPRSLPASIHSTAVRISIAPPSAADLWLQTVAQGFGATETPPEEVFTVLAPNFHSANAMCFFAWMDGQPAGGGAMYLHDGVAELGGASTRVAFRRRGVQTALLAHRLAAAASAGCDLALVGTTPGTPSQRNVERVGFQLAYTKAILVQI